MPEPVPAEPPVPTLVPELVVSNLEQSLTFWVEVLGFRIRYDRPEHRFAYLEHEGAHVMLVERRDPSHPRGETWTGGALEAPFGRGINFQIAMTDIAAPRRALERLGWPLFREPREAWYRKGAMEVGQQELMIQDPDGYLVRLTQTLGQRPHTP